MMPRREPAVIAVSIIAMIGATLIYLHPWTATNGSHSRTSRPAPLNVIVNGTPGPAYAVTDAGFRDAHTAWIVTSGSPSRGWIWRDSRWVLAFEGPIPLSFGLNGAGGWFALIQGSQLLEEGGVGGGPVPAGCQLLADRSGPRLCLTQTGGDSRGPVQVQWRPAGGTTWSAVGKFGPEAATLVWAAGMTGDGKIAWVAEGDAARSILATSNDGGASWFQSSVVIPRVGYQWRGVIGPVDGQGTNIAVAVRWYDGEVFDHLTIEQSQDGGRTFTLASNPSGFPIDNPVVSMAGEKDWAVVSQNRFALTHDAGIHWQVRGAPSNGLVVKRLALTADGAVFCVMSSRGVSGAERIFRSTDDGATFVEIALPTHP